MVLLCEASCLLKYFCTIINAEYALSFGLELCLAIGAIHIEASGDSLLVVQQISKGYQCFDGSLIVYLLVCLDARFTLVALKLFIFLGMTIQKSSHRKHPATMLIMVYCISINSRCLVSST